jgi:ribosomal protein S27AE
VIQEKRCPNCQIIKLLSEFHKDKRSKDGTSSWCKECRNNFARSYREQNPEKVKQSKEKYTAKNKKNINKSYKKYYLLNPKKKRAHNLVYKAIASGKLIKQQCAICGETKTEAHHEDYNKPLEVIWLCRQCHKTLHQLKNLDGG